jgi:hypothetical protein
MTPITTVSAQNQVKGLLSGFLRMPTNKLLGRLTVQLDAHRVQNDAAQNSTSDVRAIATQIT